MCQPADLDRYFERIMTLVDEAGRLIAERQAQPMAVRTKSSDVDLLTETDQDVERLLIGQLRDAFPGHRFIGEEQRSGDAPTDGDRRLTALPTWIIDPIDGTMNFVHGFPHSCVSVALLIDGRAELAIVHNPLLGQKFWARRGAGAFLNGRRIRVSGQTRLADALLATEFGTSRDERKLLVVLDNLAKVARAAHGVRSLGAAALNMAMVALGAVDCNYEFGIHVWDIAAGDLLVREAGGVCIDPAGGPLDLMGRRVLCASSPELAQSVARLLTQFQPEPRDDQ